MLSLYCLGGLVCVILHRLSTLARGHFAMDSSKRKPGRPKNKPRGKPANPDVSQKLPKNQREQQKKRLNKRKSIDCGKEGLDDVARHVQNETKNNSKYALIYNTVS